MQRLSHTRGIAMIAGMLGAVFLPALYYRVDTPDEAAAFEVLTGVGLILAVTCAGLLLTVERAARALRAQQRVLRERSDAMQALYGRMLKSEETARSELVAGLRGSMAQVLDSTRRLLATCGDQTARSLADQCTRESVAAMLQDTVRDIRSIARDLHQSRMDEFGLQPAVDLFCSEFEHLFPGNLIEQQILPPGDDQPGMEKLVFYRIAEAAFKNFVQFAEADQIQILLRRENGAETPPLDEPAAGIPDAAPAQDSSGEQRRNGLAEELDRLRPAGGVFSATRTATGGILLRASWSK